MGTTHPGKPASERKPSLKDWCGKCPAYRQENIPSRFGCCRFGTNCCLKSGSVICCYELDYFTLSQKRHERSIATHPKLKLTNAFPPSKSMSQWICPECGEHTETELITILSRWAKRRCKTCTRTYFGIKFFEEAGTGGEVKCALDKYMTAQ